MSSNKIEFQDQMGRKMVVPFPPKRIVSLVPSQTELLFELDLEREVIGITKFCVYPKEWKEKKAKIGGTKTPKINDILDLEPDLIIANKEENPKEAIEELHRHCPVWVSDVKTLEDAKTMILRLGLLTMRKAKAQNLCQTIQTNFEEYRKIRQTPNLKTAYLIWQNPYMTIGHDTFIHHLVSFVITP